MAHRKPSYEHLEMGWVINLRCSGFWHYQHLVPGPENVTIHLDSAATSTATATICSNTSVRFELRVYGL